MMERKISELSTVEFPDDAVSRQYQELENVVAAGNPKINLERLRAAYLFARKYHGDQLRQDGSPYITHPLSAALIFAQDIMLDEDALVACLLHDIVEDTEVTYKDVERIFGTTVADLVDGVTKLTRIVYTSKDEEQTENIRKTLLATAKDPRVMMIKLADRLHNLRTLDYKSIVKQRDKAAETIEIYAPIAHRLGMQKIKWELEDRSIKYLDPDAVVEIEAFLAEHYDNLQQFMQTIRQKIEDKLAEEKIVATVQSRLKHLYSIYRKMYAQNKELREVHDLCAFRIIVEDGSDKIDKDAATDKKNDKSSIDEERFKGECYHILGSLGTIFHPVPGKYKDYIAGPKPNGYRSIHNTYIGKTGILFEIQIRTREMHTSAEYGVAAHWKYKKGGNDGVNAGDDEQYSWIRDMLGRQEDLEPEKFKDELRNELFSDAVMVFTPKGRILTLPAGATPIDFAYRLHSDIGNHISGAKVNGRIVPIDSRLESGAVIEILTSNATKGPSLDWLDIVHSGEARGKIRQWFKKERRSETIAIGKSSFEDELKRAKISNAELNHSGVMDIVLPKLSLKSMEDLYAAIGIRSRSASHVVNRIHDELIRINKEAVATSPTLDDAPEISIQKHQQEPLVSTKSGVLVDGLPDCEVKFAKCCGPVPGDEIIGFVTQGHGISVHRKNCTNYINAIANGSKVERWIDVSWGNSEQTYLVGFSVSADNRINLIIDIMGALNAAKVNVVGIIANKLKDQSVMVHVTIEAHNAAEAAYVGTRLQQIPSVRQVERHGAE